MRSFALFFLLLFITASIHAQRIGADTLAGYIVRSGTDTIRGNVILAYKLVKVKKEFQKEYDRDAWFRRVVFIDSSGNTDTLRPHEISAYGWILNDSVFGVFRSFDVVIPHKGMFLTKGSGTRFLQLELGGPMTLYLYRHTENTPGSSGEYNERYLVNEKGEMKVLKIKAWLGIAYNLTDVESWFEGYPGLSQLKMKDMMPIEVWMLVMGYNLWKTGGRK